MNEDSMQQMMIDVAEVLSADMGYAERYARFVAHRVVMGLRTRVRGRTYRIAAPDKVIRNEAMRRAFDGTNLAEVCKLFGVSLQQGYRIIKRETCT